MLSNSQNMEGHMIIKLPLTKQKSYLNALNTPLLDNRRQRPSTFFNPLEEKFSFRIRTPSMIEDAEIMAAIHRAAVTAASNKISVAIDNNRPADVLCSSRPKTTLGLVNFAASHLVGNNSQLLADSFSQSNQQLPASSFDSAAVTLRDILVKQGDNETRLRPQSRSQHSDKRLANNKPTLNLHGVGRPISPNSSSASTSLTSPINLMKGSNDTQASSSGNMINFSLSFDVRGLRPADSATNNRSGGSVASNFFGPGNRPLRFTRGSLMGVTANNLLHESENMIAMGTLISPSQIGGTMNYRSSASSDANGSANFSSYGSKNIMSGRAKPFLTNGFVNGKQNVALSSERYSYSDPLPSGLASFNQRLTELSNLEQDTIRWERSRNVRRKRSNKPDVC